MKKLIWTGIIALIHLMLLTFPAATQAQNSKVYLIPTLHDLHKTNRQYNYDSLRNIVSRIHPDIIAVEIRPEDIKGDSNYLRQNYPYEMWMMSYWFSTTPQAGFDWLGADIENMPVPANYWKFRSQVKQLERNLDADSTFNQKLNRCKSYQEQRMLLLQNSSLKGLYNSNDPIITKEYYDCLNLQLQNTQYEALTQFYEQRNQKMEERISHILQQYPGKTIVILTGDDHYPYLREYLQKQKVVLLRP